ncbi:hypothetical protein XFF1815_180124 [Xanthomonas citri pv. fuscans]|nr:hypothetical protein XFF1815_180124 [Xanthomonas citri pv. fuscans]
MDRRLPPYPDLNFRASPWPALAARGAQGTCAHGAQAVPPRPGRESGLKASLNFFETFSGHGNNLPRPQHGRSMAAAWHRAAHGSAATANQTDVCRAEEPIPGRAIALTEASS